ncbi:MAG: hypothetical protein NT075_02995 [Chloroflexi bacterium]|nr:hypothetical protein [Chloroflexota bacterium]
MSNEPQSAMARWQAILQTPALVAYFRGVFNQIGIQVVETGEQFTVAHTGEQITFAPAIHSTVDFVVPVTVAQVQNLVNAASDGQIDADEAWQIVQVLFTPMTKATLQTPVLADPLIQKLAGVEDLLHIYLLNPSGGEAATHTLTFAKGQWQVTPGLHGTPRRIYRLTPEQALLYQRRIFQAAQQNALWTWCQFALWYRQWRQTVSTPVGA